MNGYKRTKENPEAPGTMQRSRNKEQRVKLNEGNMWKRQVEIREEGKFRPRIPKGGR